MGSVQFADDWNNREIVGVPRSLIYRKEISASVFRIACLLMAGGEDAEYSISAMASRLGMDRGTVRNAVRQLETLGLVLRVRFKSFPKVPDDLYFCIDGFPPEVAADLRGDNQ